MDSLYEMISIWEQFGQAIDNKILAFLFDCCFKHSLLAFTSAVVVEKI